MRYDYNFEVFDNKFYIHSNKEDMDIEFEKKSKEESNIEIEGKFFKVNIEGNSSRIENIRQKIHSLSSQSNVSLKTIYAAILEVDEDKVDSDQLYQAFGSIQSIACKTSEWLTRYDWDTGEKISEKIEGAAAKDSKERIKVLLQQESQLTDKLGQLQQHRVSHLKSTGIFDQITHFYWKCVNQEDKLSKKLKKHRIKLIKELKKYQELTPINSISDLSQRNIIFQHMLSLAIRAEQFVLIQELLKNGTRITINHLFDAVRINSPQLMEQILELNKEIDINQPVTTNHLTLLHFACSLKNQPHEAIQCLIKHGAKIDVREPLLGFTPLHFGIFRGTLDLETIQLLLEHSPDVYARDNKGKTLLHYAITLERNNEKLLLLLLKYLNPNVKDNEGVTPLQEACRIGDDNAKRAVLALIKAGADVTVCDNVGSTPLHDAALRSSGITNDSALKSAGITIKKMKEIIQILLSNGANVKQQNNLGETPLHLAVFRRFSHSKEIVSEFIKQGADIDAQDKDGNTPLHYAARSGYVEAVQLLLEHKAQKNIRNKEGYLPVGWTNDVFESANSKQIVNLLMGES